MGFVIAIDGPAASGKGTLARRLANHFHVPHLDTGLLYRATAAKLLSSDLPLEDTALAAEAARSLRVREMDRDALSAHAIGEAASKVAVIPAVRAALLMLQQDFAAQEEGAVLDGRDIGTVICPSARVKLFITALPEVRAERRYKEAKARDASASYDAILADIKKRDDRDQNRADAPLKAADDAHLIDTSEMDIEQAFQTALAHVEAGRDK